MSVTTSTDPVQTVIDLLDNASSGDWTNGTPDRIERSEDSESSEKLRNTRLNDVSLYVWSPVEGQLDKWSAEGGTDQTETVRVDIYTNSDSSSNTYAGDVLDILKTYTNDNEDQTAWVDIWPDEIDDQTAEGFYREGYEVVSVVTRLRGYIDRP